MTTPHHHFGITGPGVMFAATLFVLLASIESRAAGELVLTTGFNPTMATAIGKETLPVRKTLADNTTVNAVAATEVMLVAATVQDGRVAPIFRSKPFKIKAGVNKLPSEQFLPSDKFLPGHEFVRGDLFIPNNAEGQWHAADQFSKAAQIIASAGTVGRARIDWKKQSVLLIGIVPTDARAAAATQLRTIAFIMGSKFAMPERFD